jgi:hypothetical protein
MIWRNMMRNLRNMSKNQLDPFLEEYNTLRAEILDRHNTRIKTLQFTIITIGSIIGVIGILLRFYLTNDPELNLMVVSNLILLFSTFGMVIIAAALFLTRINARQTHIIAGYIREFLENEIDSLNYETRWKEYRSKKLSGGTSYAVSWFYIYLAIPLVLLVSYVIYLISFDKHLFDSFMLLFSVIFFISLIYVIIQFIKLHNLKEPPEWG